MIRWRFRKLIDTYRLAHGGSRLLKLCIIHMLVLYDRATKYGYKLMGYLFGTTHAAGMTQSFLRAHLRNQKSLCQHGPPCKKQDAYPSSHRF
jgi:hypothetical protein